MDDVHSLESLDRFLYELDRGCVELDRSCVAGEEEGERECWRRPTGCEVYLSVYDMVWLNSYISPLGIGAFHTGVEVYGREYAYGGHPYSYTGVYDMEPRQQDEVGGQGVRYRESLRLGHTHLGEGEVRELVHKLGKEYNGDAYHVLNRNCNHFSSVLSQHLCGAVLPRWINRLAYVSSWMPFLLNCLPPAWLMPGEDGTSGGSGVLYSSRSGSHSRASVQHDVMESESSAQTGSEANSA